MRYRPPPQNRDFVVLALALSLLVAGCAAPTISQSPTSEPIHVANETGVEYTHLNNLEPNERPHGLSIRNEKAEPVVVTVRVERESEVIFDRTYELAPDAVVTGNLTYEANYTITVMHGARGETIELPRSTFDCNIAATGITVGTRGLDSGTGGTLMYCPEDPPGDD